MPPKRPKDHAPGASDKGFQDELASTRRLLDHRKQQARGRLLWRCASTHRGLVQIPPPAMGSLKLYRAAKHNRVDELRQLVGALHVA